MISPEQILDEWTRKKILPGAALRVQRSDTVLVEHASGYADVKQQIPANVNHIWVTASLAKPVATTALMQIVDQGMVHLDQPVQELLPEFPHREVKIRHLVTHTSGLGGMEPEPEMIQELGRIEAIAAGGLLFEPGTRCSYSTPAFDLVEAIVCKCSGLSWIEYTKRNIFDPLRMNHTSYRPPVEWENRIPTVYDESHGVDPWWNNRDLRAIGLAGGGLFSTLSDLGLFANAFLQNVHPILSAESAREMVSLQTEGLFNIEGQPQTWGLGWYLNQDGGTGFGSLAKNTFGHGGATGTFLCVDPERELIVVKMSNQLGITLDDGSRMMAELIASIIDL